MKTNYNPKNWSLFEITTIKYHYQAIGIQEKQGNPLKPNPRQTRQFMKEMKIPEDFYRTLLRELHAMAKYTQTKKSLTLFKEKCKRAKIHNHTNPAKRYYITIAIAKEMKEDIWILDITNFKGCDPFTTKKCTLCTACWCRDCRNTCVVCGCSHCKICIEDDDNADVTMEEEDNQKTTPTPDQPI